MEKIYEMCLDIIKATLNKLEKDVDYEDIKEYLELKKIEVEEEKKKIKDPSSEYIDNLVKGLK